jgi:hypothetical protein
MAVIGSPYKIENGAVLIELRLHRLAQLFNSFDPAPFLEKDLDADAEAYIVGAAREIAVGTPLKLVLHLPVAELAAEATGAEEIGASIRNYFAYQQDVARRGLHEFLRQGRASLVIGLVFLITCMTARELVATMGGGAVNRLLAEGLLIIGWVAMWRPLQIFLYDWWPIRRTGRIYAALARAPVELRPPT